ncbi:OSCP, subunit 5 of the stator stalk of mitochondrial F1F0 ATP synthase [Schizopora paradoxa]|uniref:ATP synthase subunit 5, mitochondrial n=1 Tax=Schizopora paradoxa TaxID=27342 RepID=A0A0H2S2S8_9AGAM|nr:OSCP, subunit 5 of the stator stalk of mitochondrial F1F0 ATP synthase [Schizopora paradoxa]
MLASKALRPLSSCSGTIVAAHAGARRNASTIALKYSNAAYKAALSKSPQTLTKVQAELAAISSSVSETPALSAFISNPLIPSNERSAGLEALYKAAALKGVKEVSDVTRNLFSVLSENGRLAEAPGVIEGFNELVSQYKGELDVIVTSAAPLPKDVLSRLESSLKQSEVAKAAKVVRVANKVNPSVLGGIVVDIGDKTIDLSVSSRVNKLNSLLQRMLVIQGS